jgi:hypothetical protein
VFFSSYGEVLDGQRFAGRHQGTPEDKRGLTSSRFEATGTHKRTDESTGTWRSAMLTTGNLVVAWLSDEGAHQFLGLERSDEGRSRWVLFGKVAGTPEALGLWLDIERIEQRELGVEAKIKETWSVTPRTCLIRFDFIITVQYFHDPKEPVGFQVKSP